MTDIAAPYDIHTYTSVDRMSAVFVISTIIIDCGANTTLAVSHLQDMPCRRLSDYDIYLASAYDADISNDGYDVLVGVGLD